MKKNEDAELLREYLKEAILLEYANDPTSGGRALKNVVGLAVKQLRTGKEALKGDLARGVARTARGVAQIFGNVIQVATLGMYEHGPVQEKINSEYAKVLGEIEAKYGGAKRELDAAFSKNIEPILKAGILYNPVATLGAVAAHKGLKKLQNAVTKMELKSGTSASFQKNIDNAYAKLQNQIKTSEEKYHASKKQNQSSRIEKTRDRLSLEKKQMEDLGMKGTPLYTKHVETLEIYNNALKPSSS